MKTNYEQIVDVSKIGTMYSADMNPVIQLAMKENLPSANNDKVRRLLLGIDVQKDFMDGGALGVDGAVQDVERITKFIYDNMSGITQIMSSLDTHTPFQIFHPCWWQNANGDNPAPYTVITEDDEKNGLWHPVVGPTKSVNYLKKLAEGGKKQLCIWPYHCLQGTPGHGLDPEYAKMVMFHGVARKTYNPMVRKGDDPYSEMYGIIKPEYSESNFINTPVLNAIQKADEVYVYGEAASHCLMESVAQIVDYFAQQPDVIQKITILEDCTSPIGGFEDATKVAFDNFKKLGVKFAKSIDVHLV